MLGDDERKYEDEAKRLLERVFVWGHQHMNGVIFPGTSMRNRLATWSFNLALDLIGSVRTLSAHDQRSGALVLHRSIVENFLRGFWFAYVADEGLVNRYTVGKYTNTAKTLAMAIRKSGKQDDCKVLMPEGVISHFDELTHGGIRHLKLRDVTVESNPIEKIKTSANMLVLCACYVIFLVEIQYRVGLNNDAQADALYEEGRMLFYL